VRQQQREALEEAVRRIEAESGNGQSEAEGPFAPVKAEPEAAKEQKVKKQAQVEIM